MNTRYYIPIKSVNLAHYFSKGIVCPANYISNRNDDIQSRFTNYLLLSKSKFTLETNCALEIVFNEKEEQPKSISPNFYLFDMPLAISRIKAIIFKEETQKKSTIFNITSGAAFLPSKLIVVDNKSTNIDTEELSDIKYSKSTKDWTQSIDKFNRILGGIALMSIAKNDTEGYPQNYFNTLSNFNKLIASQLSFESNNKIDYSWAFDGNKLKKLYEIIYSPIDAETLEYIASGENINLKIRNGLYVFDNIPEKKTTYLAAILATYGQEKRKQIDSFISDFKSGKFSESRKEGLALTFGINKGYSTFRNRYKTHNFQVDVKFKLDSQLDYYTIESIYQFVFYNKSDSTNFEFIDKWCPKFQNPTNGSQNTFRILDKDIISSQKKTDSSKSFQNIFKKSSGNRIRIYEKITAQFANWLPSFAKQNNSEANQYFETELNEVISNFAHDIYLEAKEDSNRQLHDLQQEIKQKDVEIQKLKKQIQQQNQSIPVEVEKIEITRVSEPIETYSKHNSNNSIGGLFQDNSPHLSEEDKRSEELYNLRIGQLKNIAKEKNIKNLSKYNTKNRQKLVDKIIKKEFQD